jgi:hypothetical protein
MKLYEKVMWLYMRTVSKGHKWICDFTKWRKKIIPQHIIQQTWSSNIIIATMIEPYLADAWKANLSLYWYLSSIMLWVAEFPIFSRQSAKRWRWSYYSYALAGRPLSPGISLIQITCGGCFPAIIIFLYFTTSRPAVDPIQPPSRRVLSPWS